jgi:hypothetical protein
METIVKDLNGKNCRITAYGRTGLILTFGEEFKVRIPREFYRYISGYNPVRCELMVVKDEPNAFVFKRFMVQEKGE